MWKVRLARHMYVRPQLILVWGMAVCICVGVYATTMPPAIHTVVSEKRPRVAGVVLAAPVRTPVDCGITACLALTFDDGPRSDTTPAVLDILARHKVRATFFVQGSHVKGNEDLLRRMYQEGHEIGNHSWNHPHFTTLSPELMREQVNSTQAVIAGTGVPVPKLFRPPYGDVNASVEAVVPMTIALWNIDPEDWLHKKPEEIVQHVRDRVGPGRVVVMHDTHKQTVDALDQLVADLQKDYALVTFSELFNLTSGQPGRYYGR